MSTMTAESMKQLREPFAPEVIGKLPRSTCKACSEAQFKRCDRHTWIDNCPMCHGRHSSATLHLDYVGHAAATDRLLKVDPAWSWEPYAVGPDGLPALDRSGNLWIRLTVCGVTRPGVGDGNSLKEKIGDAIRNAAMRFGVALDLWAKEDLNPPRDSTDIETPAPPPDTRQAPPLPTAKARAWTAVKAKHPGESDASLKAITEAALAAVGSSIADADTETWNALAEQWEAK